MKKIFRSILFVALICGLVWPFSAASAEASAPQGNLSTVFLPMISRLYNPGMVVGTVVNASTGKALPGVHVCVGKICGNSTSTGRYALQLAEGAYGMLAVKTGYYNFTRPVKVETGKTIEVTVSMSPNDLGADELRIVLTWSGEGDPSNPNDSDLDANLWIYQGPHINWQNPGNCAVDGVCLENDSFQFGPETIVIKKKFPGIHAYAVNRNASDFEITQFGALVTIYDSSGAIATFASPTTGAGSWWYVFDLTGETGEITLVNQVSSSAPH